MIEIKEAHEKARQILKKTPSLSSLRDWTSGGLISAREDYIRGGRPGGNRGLYPERIVPEILTVVSLKDKVGAGLSTNQAKEARTKAGGKELTDQILENPNKDWGEELRNRYHKSIDHGIDQMMGKNDMSSGEARAEYLRSAYALYFWEALEALEREGIMDREELKEEEAKEKVER